MELRDVMLRKTNQPRKANSVSSHLHVEDKKAKVIHTESRTMVTKAWGMEGMGRHQRVQNSKMNMSWESNVNCH